VRSFRRRQQIDVIAGTDIIDLVRHQNPLLAHKQRRPRPGWNEASAQVRAICRNGIADEFLGQLAGKIEFHAARMRVMPWQGHVQPMRRKRDSPTLDKQ
jgi:hypothetical protein